MKRLVLGVTAAAVLAAAGVAGFRLTEQPEVAAASDTPPPGETVMIKKTNLSQDVEVPGELGFGSARTVKSRLPGTITWLPKPGTTIRRGEVLFRVDNKPVILLYGGTPLFRTLGAVPPPKTPSKTPPGTPPATPPATPANTPPVSGPDVKVLKRNLAELGFLSAAKSDKFTSATGKAIKEWQQSLDLPATGTLDPATVVVLPGQIRVGQLKVSLGDPGQGEILGATSSAKVVTMPIDAAATYGVRAGLKVKLELPNGKRTTGEVLSVSTDAALPPGDGVSDAGKKPQVIATIALDNQSAASGIDSGPVTVTLPGAGRNGVLAVPVGALLALREGGYAVQVVEGTQIKLVAVKTGMFADDLVEITGKGLKAGQKVVTTS
ncbi:peptidoglycan-binding protein [Kribbella deserti]|uniref:Peptidoglycan-binding protein n=1 Tax=Kribbella deserti TaxID=1926257 RepID=A0ABV6QHE1_9ACTN